jgi:heme oxygenase
MIGSGRYELLRRATSEAQDALDAKIGPFNSIADYEVYLRGIYAFRAPLEPVISAIAGDFVGGGWLPCLIVRELELDLADLNLPKPRLIPFAAPTSRDEAIGYLYVLEGAALGARVRVERVTDLGLNAAWGTRHLFKQAEAASSWRSFSAALEASDLNPSDMVRGAEAAFRLAHGALSKSLVYA